MGSHYIRKMPWPNLGPSLTRSQMIKMYLFIHLMTKLELEWTLSRSRRSGLKAGPAVHKPKAGKCPGPNLGKVRGPNSGLKANQKGHFNAT